MKVLVLEEKPNAFGGRHFAMQGWRDVCRKLGHEAELAYIEDHSWKEHGRVDLLILPYPGAIFVINLGLDAKKTLVWFNAPDRLTSHNPVVADDITYVCNSYWAESVALERWPYLKGYTTVFHSPIDYSDFKKAARPHEERDFDFAFVGGHNDRGADKGFDTYCRLINEYTNYNFLVVAKEESITQELLPKDRVCRAWNQSRKQIAQYLGNTRYLLHPSLIESTPLVIYEALNAGCIPIAMDTGAVKEQLGSFGILLANRDEFHQCIKNLTPKSGSRIREMIEHGSKFDVNNRLNRAYDLLKAADPERVSHVAGEKMRPSIDLRPEMRKRPHSRRPRILAFVDSLTWAAAREIRNSKRHLNNWLDIMTHTLLKDDVPDDIDLVHVKVHTNLADKRRTFGFHNWPSCPVLVNVCARYVLEPSPFQDSLMRAAGHTRYFSTPDADLRDRLEEMLPDGCNVFYLPEGIDTEEFYSVDHKGKITVGWAGKPDHMPGDHKGYDTIWKPLREQFNDEYSFVEATGDVPAEHMANFYQGCDIFCLTSKHETVGACAYQAAACGCWVISTDTGYAPKYIIPGRNGEIVEREERVFGDAISRVGANQIASAHKINGWLFPLLFDAKLTAQRHLMVYQRILREEGGWQ